MHREAVLASSWSMHAVSTCKGIHFRFAIQSFRGPRNGPNNCFQCAALLEQGDAQGGVLSIVLVDARR